MLASPRMASGQSQYKATLAKTLLEDVDALAPADRAKVLAEVDPVHLQAIRQAPRTAWISAEHQLAVDGAIERALGPEALENLVRAYVSKAVATPLFRPFMRGATSLFGVNPASLYRVMPRAWALTSRNAGVIAEQGLGERSHEVRYESLPPLLRRSSFAVTTRASLLGILDLMDATGVCETDLSPMSGGTITHRISWRT